MTTTNTARRDDILDRLAARHLRGQPLPPRITIGGGEQDTAEFLTGFKYDRRDASGALAAIVPNTVERPWISEAVGTLLAALRPHAKPADTPADATDSN